MIKMGRTVDVNLMMDVFICPRMGKLSGSLFKEQLSRENDMNQLLSFLLTFFVPRHIFFHSPS